MVVPASGWLIFTSWMQRLRFLVISKMRGFVGTGENVLIGGLIIGSGEPPVIVLRAIGPTLSSFGIAQPLQDPTIELHDANGVLIAFDNDWNDNTPTAIKATLLKPTDSRESTLVVSRSPPGITPQLCAAKMGRPVSRWWKPTGSINPGVQLRKAERLDEVSFY